MINENIYSKLTPSAKETLNELSEEYKSSLVEKAFTIAQERDTANKEISLRDILEAKQPLQRDIEKRTYFDNRRKRWTILISFSGAIYAVAGLLIYLFQNKKFSIENDLGLIIAIVGILLSLVAFLYGQLISKSSISTRTFTTAYTTTSDNYEIVKRWHVIENLAKKLMTETDKEMSKSVSFLIRFLSHKIAKNEQEFLKIRELLQLRNKILHEQYNLSDNERKEFLYFADDLIERLELAQTDTDQKENNLKVLNAKYGTPKQSYDATQELNQLIKNNRLEFIINNEIVGDPDHGTMKTMTIVYEINGIKQTKTYNEGEKVVIDG